MTDDMTGRVAIVTGAGSGIGATTALWLARRGASVAVVDIDGAAAAGVATEIAEDATATGTAMAVTADVAVEADVVAAVEAVRAELGEIDALHNNAGAVGRDTIGRDGDIRRLDVDVWDRTMAVNLRGTMLFTKHVLPSMIAKGGGAIVNTSSGSGLTGHATRAAYGASKAGVNMFTQYVATAFGRDDVRCNAVAPGLILTPAAERNLSADDVAMFARHTLTTRLGRPEDVAAMVTFLLSDAAGFVTGQIISVDGGALAHTPTYAEVEVLRTEREAARFAE